MPSLFNQFVPSVSSSANTDFIRCWADTLGDGDCRATTCGGSMTRAMAGGGAAGVREGVRCSCAGGGAVAGLGGVAGVTGTEGCTRLVEMLGVCRDVGATSAVSRLPAATIFSADLFASGAKGSTGTDACRGTSTPRGPIGGSAGSIRGVAVDGAIGSGDGQLLIPPACTVLHQGQRTGSALAAGAAGCAAIGGAGAGSAGGAADVSVTTGVFDGATGTPGCDASE